MLALRHLAAILVLPCTAALWVPLWALGRFAREDTRWAGGIALAGQLAGAALAGAGLLLVGRCVWLFGRVGRGTLAPWDPPRGLVVRGPYRHVRNPMISGVLAVITGEALFLGSRVLAGWALTFLAINQLYFLASEEPGLERRFGERYRAYRAAVPRWVPRVRGWDEDGS